MVNTTLQRFALTFVIGCAILMGGFEAARGTAFERFVVERLILAPTADLINMAAPGEHVELVGRTLVSPDGANLRITRGCEGIELFLLLTAAIAAFPASFRHRVRGLLLGTGLAYALSIARLMLLHYILRYDPARWEALHGFILPLGPVVLLSLYFLYWSAASPTPSAAPPAPHAA